MHKQYFSAFTKPPVLVAGLFIALILPLVSLPEITKASISNTRLDAWGTDEYSGSSWMTSNGGGVDVYSNGPTIDLRDCSGNIVSTYAAACKNSVNFATTGAEWQCVELFNRLYLTKGWITSTWTGNGNQLYNIATLPTGFSKEDNTHTTFINPGDAITFDDGGAGHVVMVDSVSGSTVNVVSQNTQGVRWTVNWNTTTHTLTQTYLGSSYSVQGIIHRPSPPPPPAAHWISLAGDWDGNGTDTIGLFNPNTNIFYLRNSNTPGNADITVAYGNPGWIPVVGDWTGKGYDSIGLYDPIHSTFYLRNSNSSGNADLTFTYGNSSWAPIMGDWDGNGTTTVGVYDHSGSTFYLRNSNSTGNADITVPYGNPN